MISPIRFAASYMITGKPHQLEDARAILEREAAKRDLLIHIENTESPLLVFTGDDAAEFRDAAATSMMDRFDRDRFSQLVADAESNSIEATEGFQTSHYNYQLVYGQPTFDVETGKPHPPRPGFEPSLKPAPVPGTIGDKKKTCIT